MITLREVSKFYYTKTSVVLGLRRVNLEFHKGEFVAITGESGSGKSTLLNVISGMDTYEGGEMYINGEETSLYGDAQWEHYRRRKISFVYQSYQLIDSYTALENVMSVIMISHNGVFNESQAKEKALACLKQVGLEGHARQKASHMSSGQKQRLGIARALAKDTDIIVADEPTGNLDSENGMQVMKLLHDLSKDKLVIVVTHNYEQAAPYVTRRIRMHEGDVVEDIQVNQRMREQAAETMQASQTQTKTTTKKTAEQPTEQPLEKEKKQKEKKEKAEATKTSNTRREDTGKVARRFVHMNRFAQPHRTLLLLILMVVSTLAIFIFAGNFVANLDSTIAKKTSTNIVSDVESTRIIVRNLDGSAMTEDTLEQLKTIPHVETVEAGDTFCDINYYWQAEEDYSIQYEYSSSRAGSKSVKMEFLKDDQFVRSCNQLSEDDLAAGQLPENENEIVCYSDDESLLGKTISVYFTSGLWGSDCWAERELVVTGLLKEDAGQVYFSDVLCNNLSIYYGKLSTTINYNKITEVFRTDDVDDYTTEFPISTTCFIVCDTQLGDYEVQMSQQYFLNMEEKEFSNGQSKEYVSETGTIAYTVEDGTKQEVEVTLKQSGNGNARRVISVGQKVFDEITADIKDKQTSIYIEDYGYTDLVLKALGNYGCEGASALRVSTTGYDTNKLQEQLVTLGISAAALVVASLLFLIVIHALMKLKREDFNILLRLGLKRKIIKYINIWDLSTGMILASIVSIGIIWFMKAGQQAQIIHILHYIRWYHYLAFIIYSAILGGAAGQIYNRYLLVGKKRKRKKKQG
jgi:ABC-type lipoprotein export system ATPase subunit